ncbi:hypothetical protein N7460_000109 [Penicillium canescens]|uniref:Heterokaryon incompatibility domain-containing protein n=1 Tax=Penicillium canescens TaxID=5083 RepID=A0AAD6ILX8_PENCN|nr:hypothetical protein N7444_011748 [Penicillium canescens]KAJ6056835.1 hypothetical protein N7460_000109 [Penicillium canescens]
MAPFFPFRRKKPSVVEIEEAEENLRHRYNGHRHWASGKRFQRPFISPESLTERRLELEDPKHSYGKQSYLNPNRENDHKKYIDLDTYYSTNKSFPRRLIVQATPEVYAETDNYPRHWGRSRIHGKVPFIISLSELCLNPFGFRRYEGVPDEEDDGDGPRQARKENRILTILKGLLHWITSTALTLSLAWIIQLMISVEIVTSPWNDDGSAEPYEEYQNVHWYWPKHAINVLDQSPANNHPQSTVAKLTVPRSLVVRDEVSGAWVSKNTKDLRDKKTGMLPSYIFLSFSRANFVGTDEVKLREILYSVAERMLEHENVHRDPQTPSLEAFWVDVDCVSGITDIPAGANESPKTQDVNSICDAVRCAHRVYIVLPSDSVSARQTWGSRIWTLPEVLLAANKTRYCFTESTDIDLLAPHDVSLNDMYESFWKPPTNDEQVEHEDAIGHLISHYTNTIKLSELQLFTFAVQVMAKLSQGRDVEGYTTRDMAYAAMGLLSYRITPCDDDNTFQAIARLSLVNDSNQLLERLVCLWPNPEKNPRPLQAQQDYASAGSETLLCNIADRDQYLTHLWDIHPICDVVGIGDDSYEPTIIMDRCKGIPIRWKDFPRLRYAKEIKGLGATASQSIVYFGAWALATGFGLFSTAMALAVALSTGGKTGEQASNTEANDGFTNAQLENLRTEIIPNYLVAIGIFFALAWIISWFAPWAVRQLCNEGTKGTSSHLVGFEGTMSLHDLEKAMYGNYNHRLLYAASSTVFSGTMPKSNIRVGREPLDPGHWKKEMKRLGFPGSYRLFTIVDTGSMTVSVIAAERPPVVALICGREGGMLRVLLCSWRFERNCLYRECVVRMRSSLEEQATYNDWLKISLASQGDVARTRVSHLQYLRQKQIDEEKARLNEEKVRQRKPVSEESTSSTLKGPPSPRVSLFSAGDQERLDRVARQ